MAEISATKLNKSYGSDIVLEDISFVVEKGERIGIIGSNGAGKSTLLKMLAGHMEPSSGSYRIEAGSRVGYLRQDTGEYFDREGDDDPTPLSIMRSAYARLENEGVQVYESEIRGLLKSMAFDETMTKRPFSKLSGGEKTRLAFAVLLMEKPDVLLLDEPTNHLDISTLTWLEQKLKSYAGTIVLVTHDRYFLDKVVDRIFEIEHAALKSYPGSYSAYAEKKRLMREHELAAYMNQQAELKRQQDMIRHMKERGTEKLAKRAASREKRLAHTELVRKPESLSRHMKISLNEKNRSGNDVIEGVALSKSFGRGDARRTLFENVNFDIKRGERICMVGANGAGKTTLLRIALGRLAPDGGYIRKGVGVRIGYYDQEQRFPDTGKTVLEEMTTSFPLISETQMRGYLGRFLFTGDMVFREISKLSGGERAKISMLKLLLSGSNTLLLDEPTNHLDIPSREAIEDALLEFPGTVVVVSHDRYFLNKVPTRIAELVAYGLIFYPGRYDYYMEKRGESEGRAQSMKRLSAAGEQGQAAELSEAEKVRRDKKRSEAERKRREKKLAEVEERITRLEEQISAAEAELTDPKNAGDPVYLTEKSELLSLLHKALDVKMREWESAANETLTAGLQ